MANLYISCPNILASEYAQVKLRDTFGFQILTGKEQKPHFSDRFVVVSPPEYIFCSFVMSAYRDQTDPNNWKETRKHIEKGCNECKRVADDKPVICYSPPTYDYDMNETWEKNHDWIDLFSTLKLIALTESKIQP